MGERLGYILAACIALVVIIIPASAGTLQDVPPAGTVFIGEQGLHLSGIPTGTVLSWYEGASILGRSAPDATVTVGDNRSFYVSPQVFSSHMGNWYIGNTSELGIIVQDPVQTVTVIDQKTGEDVTGQGVPSGDYLTFRVETNLYIVALQRPGTEGFLSLRVMAPDGTIYTGLWQNLTTRHSLTNLSPDTNPWYWVPLTNDSAWGWATGLTGPERERVYPAGTYTFWTECNLNGMQDNYRDSRGAELSGRTVSGLRNVTVRFDSVKIAADPKTLTRGHPFTVTISGRPNSVYYLWVKDTRAMSGGQGDQPPSLILSQEGVTMDPVNGPWPIGQYVFQGSTKTIQSDVAQRYGGKDVHGVVYYAAVTLSGAGTRTVGFSTTKDTKDAKYTIRVERPEPYNPPSSNTGSNRTFRKGEAAVTVRRGTTEIHDEPLPVRQARTYYSGDEITFSGTNSETIATYLFITGPNLPKDGGQMMSPRAPVDPEDPSTFARADVDPDENWEYTWETADLDLDPGAYTIYAVSTMTSKAGLRGMETASSDTDVPLYSTVSVLMKKPFIRADADPAGAAAGDPVRIRGLAAGQPREGVALWVFGKNDLLYKTVNVQTDGSFEYEITRAGTKELAPGEYFVVVQHPMYNEIFDAWPAPSSPGTGVIDIVAGSYPESGNTLFRIGDPGSLQGPEAAEALIGALDNTAIDDQYAESRFVIADPWIDIIPPGEIRAGEEYRIEGFTNLAPGDDLAIDLVSSAFNPSKKTQSQEFSGTGGIVTVIQGPGGRNRWGFPVDTAAFGPGQYVVEVSGVAVDTRASAWLNVLPGYPENQDNRSSRQGNPAVISTIAVPESVEETIAGKEDENITDDSGISINSRVSKFAGTRIPSPVPTSPLPPTQISTPASTHENPAPKNQVTRRPTVQPGFGAGLSVVTLILIAVGIHRKRE